MSSSPLPAWGDRLVEAALGGDLSLGRRKPTLAGRLHPDRIPAHGDVRGQLGALVIAPQRLAGIEQPVIEMAARMRPCERRFADIDRHRAAFALRAARPPRAFGGQFAFDQFAFHVAFSLASSGARGLPNRKSCRKEQTNLVKCKTG